MSKRVRRTTNREARPVTLMSPERRSPFFTVGDELFLDLAWNWGHPLVVTADVLVAFVAAAAPGQVVIGRRLGRAEREGVLDGRRESEAEVYGQIVRDDDKRWQLRRRR